MPLSKLSERPHGICKFTRQCWSRSYDRTMRAVQRVVRASGRAGGAPLSVAGQAELGESGSLADQQAGAATLCSQAESGGRRHLRRLAAAVRQPLSFALERLRHLQTGSLGLNLIRALAVLLFLAAAGRWLYVEWLLTDAITQASAAVKDAAKTKSKLADIAKELQQLKQQLSEARTEAADYAAAAKAAQRKAVEAETELAEARKQLELAQSRHTAWQRTVQEMEAKLKQAEKQSQQQQALAAAAQLKIKQLEESLAEAAVKRAQQMQAAAAVKPAELEVARSEPRPLPQGKPAERQPASGPDPSRSPAKSGPAEATVAAWQPAGPSSEAPSHRASAGTPGPKLGPPTAAGQWQQAESRGTAAPTAKPAMKKQANKLKPTEQPKGILSAAQPPPATAPGATGAPQSEPSRSAGQQIESALDRLFHTTLMDPPEPGRKLTPGQQQLLRDGFQHYELLLQRIDPASAPDRYAQTLYRHAQLGWYMSADLDALQHFEDAAGQLRSLPADLLVRPAVQRSLAETLLSAGLLYSRLGDLGRAEQSLLDACRQFEAALSSARNDTTLSARLLVALTELGSAQLALGKAERAIEAYRQAKQQSEQLAEAMPGPAADRTVADCCYNLGLAASKLARYQEAAASWNKAIELWYRLLKQRPADRSLRRAIAQANNNLGCLYMLREQWGEGRSVLEQAKQMRAELLEESPDEQIEAELAESWANLGHLELQLGNLEAAETAYGKARQLRERIIQRNPGEDAVRSALAATLQSIGQLAERRGDLTEATQRYREAIELQKAALLKTPEKQLYRSRLLQHYLSLAKLHKAQGLPNRAREVLTECRSLLQDDPEALFQIACELADLLQSARSESSQRPALRQLALTTLEQAVAHGFSDLKQLQAEKRLEPLRPDDAYKSIVAKLKAAASVYAD